MPRVDPYKSYRFLLEIDSITQAGFAECSGVGSEVAVVEYREGGDDATVRKLRGKAKYPDITLNWGITDSRELYDWHLQAVQGNVERKNGSIILLDDTGQEKVRWNFFNAWPSKYEGPAFNAKNDEVGIEKLTVTCERLEKA